MLVTFKEYEEHLIDQNSFDVSVAADVLETDFQFQAREDFRVRMPDVKFEVRRLRDSRCRNVLLAQFSGEAIAGKAMTVFAFLHNPIPRNLTRAHFVIEGPGLMEPLRLPVKRFDSYRIMTASPLMRICWLPF